MFHGPKSSIRMKNDGSQFLIKKVLAPLVAGLPLLTGVIQPAEAMSEAPWAPGLQYEVVKSVKDGDKPKVISRPSLKR